MRELSEGAATDGEAQWTSHVHQGPRDLVQNRTRKREAVGVQGQSGSKRMKGSEGNPLEGGDLFNPIVSYIPGTQDPEQIRTWIMYLHKDN